MKTCWLASDSQDVDFLEEEKSASWVSTAAPWRMAVAAIQVSCRRNRRPRSRSAAAIRAKQLATSASTGSSG